MTRRLLFAALMLVPLLGTPAGAIEPGQGMVVAFQIRASGRDAVTVCQEQPLDQTEAASLGNKVATAISLPGTETFHGAGDQCLVLRFEGPLTTPGERNEHVLRIDATRLIELGKSLGYRDVFVVVCTPRLTDRITVRRGDMPAAANGCESGGYQWRAGDGMDVDVSVRATAGDLARGFLAASSWWLALLTAASIAFGWFGKRYHWRFLRHYPAIGGAAVSALGLLAAFGWIQVAYQSGLVHTLQFLTAIGVGGELALVAIPALLSAVTVVATGAHVARDAARTFPLRGAGLDSAIPASPWTGERPPTLPEAEAGVIPAYSWLAPRAPRGVMWAYAPAISLAVAFLLLWVAPANIEIKVEGMLAASVAFAGALRLFTSGVLPWAFGAVRLPSEMEQPIVRDSREAGARVTEVWSSPVAPAALPLGGAILLAGRRAIVWEPLTGLPPSQLAAAIALRGTRARGWPLALGGSALALLTIVLTRAEGTSVPALAVLGPIGAMCAIAFVDVLERIRVRTADRSGSRAEEHIRGLLAASRAHARLAAGGALTPAEVVLPGLALSTWERAIRLARRIAEDAGLEPEVVDTIVIEIVAAEAPRARKEAPQEPVEPITARRKVAPRKKVVPRKKAAPRKKPVRKAVSGRASARSTRRSRP